MIRNPRVQMAAVLAAGILLGYAAASGKLNPFPRAEAGPHDAPAVVAPAGDDTCAGCCSEGKNRQQLLAMADPKVKAAIAKAEGEGKKPNIVVIMGDDIGMWNIGAYHRG